MKNKRMLLFLAITVLILIVMLIAYSGYDANRNKKESIGFIMTGSMSEKGWNGIHYKGVKSACDKLGVRLLVKEKVKEFSGECEEAIKELVDEGAEMIILSSYGYPKEVKDVIKKYPNIVFYANSSEYHDKNLTSYFVRMYQARYMAGIVAGMTTKTNHIGYVAAMNNNEVNRGINAFTMGVRKVNKKADVTVAWTNSWDNKVREKKATNALITDDNVDIVAYHQNRASVAETADAAGVDSIGYHQVPQGLSDHYLTTVVCKWELVYEEIIKEFMQGKANSVKNYWIGVEKGVVGLSKYSDRVSPKAREKVQKVERELLNGNDVFSGLIYDNKGHKRCGKDEMISDERLLEKMNWFVKGVKFYE